ncbi:MAG: glycoside hydrolase family 127 protein, partial [Phycisphaerae bacterium]|nr:glycoside hydrolase family 127 protein [Phycisphaerae bacterium]
MAFNALVLAVVAMLSLFISAGSAAESRLNLAPVARASTSNVSPRESLAAINDSFEPKNSEDHRHGCYGNWPEHGTQWVQLEWSQPITANGIAVYWWDDHKAVRLPKAARVSYWNGSAFEPIQATIGVDADRYNTADFSEVKTSRLRLEFDSQDNQSTGLIEWKVFDSGNSPDFPPVAHAGPDRIVVLPAPTYLFGTGKGLKKPDDAPTGAWTKTSGPGEVTFADANKAATSATFSAPGDYVLTFTYGLRKSSATDTLNVHVEERPEIKPLEALYVSKYTIDSPFWNDRLKNEVVNWIPHCIDELDKLDLKEGGIANFIEAGKKLKGQPAHPHIGPPWSDAYVLNTVESICNALELDPRGDAETIKAQDQLRAKLEQWIPIILGAQEPDGYFQTRFTLATPNEQQRGITPTHWNPRTRGEHEGYVGGYFIEMGIAHYTMTEGKDRRLLDAAIKLANCWCDHIGPAPKQPWFDGHQEIEQALSRLALLVNRIDGPGKGDKYVELSKFLLQSRNGGEDYDQSRVPTTQ